MSDDDPTASVPADPILVLVHDMIFTSRIVAEARAAGARVRIIEDPKALGTQAGRSLIADLNMQGAIEAAAAWQQATGKSVVGFVSHADTHTIAHAREAGINSVLARSHFVQKLPDLLKG